MVSGLALFAVVFLVAHNSGSNISIVPKAATPAGGSVPLVPAESAGIPLGSGNQQAADPNRLRVRTPSDNPSVLGTNRDAESNKLPGPEQFYLYEEYANATSTLYADELVGDGATASTDDIVAVAYRGWLTDGTLFEQSPVNKDGLREPFVFKLGAGQVIPGWEQGIIGMQAGGRRRLVVPAVLGYGERGNNSIPANAMLIFDVELAQVQKPPNPAVGL